MSTKARLYILDEYCSSSCRVRFQIIPLSSIICRYLQHKKISIVRSERNTSEFNMLFLSLHTSTAFWFLTHPRTAAEVCAVVPLYLLMALYIFQGEALLWISRAVMALVSQTWLDLEVLLKRKVSEYYEAWRILKTPKIVLYPITIPLRNVILCTMVLVRFTIFSFTTNSCDASDCCKAIVLGQETSSTKIFGARSTDRLRNLMWY